MNYLNTIQMMDKEQLRKTLQQSGYVEIAQMLGQLNLNGSQILATTEFQTINWKITPFQRKQLFSFIKQVKNNPSILKISSTPSVPAKPKKQLFPSQKPNIPIKKPLPQFLGKKETKPDVPEDGKNKAFKFQLEKVLGETNKSANKPTKLPSPEENRQHQGSVTTTQKKAKLPLPNDTHKNNNYYQENEYIDMMKKIQKETIDDGYSLATNDIPEDTYENLNIRTVSENGRTFPAGRNNIAQQNLPPEEDPVDIYEPPPKIVLSHKSIDDRFKLPPREPEEDTYEPPPRVTATKNLASPTSISSRGKSQPLPMLPIVQSPEDGEDTYEVPTEPQRGTWEQPVPPLFRAKSPMELSKSTIRDEQEPPLKSSLSPVIANRKPIPTPTRDDLRCRTGPKNLAPNACLISLPQLDNSPRTMQYPLSDQRNGAIKKASGNDGNYENHKMKGVKRDNRINPILNRPLPAIPSAETNNLSVDYQRRNSPFSTNSSPRANYGKSSEYVELTKNHRMNHGISETGENMDEDIQQVYQNLSFASNVPDEELPEYSNCPKLPSVVTPRRDGSVKGQNNNHQQRSIGLGKKEIRDNLALQLASELKARENKIWNQPAADLDEQPEYSNNPPKQKVISPHLPLPKPPTIISAGIPFLRESIDEDSDEFDDDDEYHNIFDINSEPFFRNTDRRGAKSLLRGYDDGAFLFRPSQHYFLVLTIKYKTKCYNLGIVRTRNNKITLNSDVGSTAPEFSSLQDFVNYFTDEALTFEDGGELIKTHLKSVLPTR